MLVHVLAIYDTPDKRAVLTLDERTSAGSTDLSSCFGEERPISAETLAAQALGDADPVSGGLAPVINPSTNYEQQPDGSYRQGRVYTRADNPTSEQAEQLLAVLEGDAGRGDSGCALFGSGMAAATAVFQSLLPGDHVLVSRVLYWGYANGWPSSRSPGVSTSSSPILANRKTWPRRSAPAVPRLIWVETLANPMWHITDLTAVCELGHAAGARVAVDNTVAMPVLTRPFEFGADLVVHSASKYLNGHGAAQAGPCCSNWPPGRSAGCARARCGSLAA